MDNKKFWFFGSKLNTALLLILIILMVIALRWMYQDREKYLGIPGDNMTSKDAEYWDDLTIKNPKLNEILGYDGKPLSKFEIEGNNPIKRNKIYELEAALPNCEIFIGIR
jgi:hypothetical protein